MIMLPLFLRYNNIPPYFNVFSSCSMAEKHTDMLFPGPGFSKRAGLTASVGEKKQKPHFALEYDLLLASEMQNNEYFNTVLK